MELVEREDVLALLDVELVASAQRGRLVLVLGEAGNGKTTLVDTWTQRHPERIRLLRGACDGSATPRPLGPLLDAMPDLVADADRTGLIASVLEHLSPPEPRPVLVIEDLHWADEATLDVVRAIAVRLPSTPCLVVLTARSDEVEPGTPLATLIGDLGRSSDVSRVALEPLTLGGVRTLVERAGATVDPGALFRRTGGNAFHATEILASGDDELPRSVRDAVLARVARLSPDARASLDVVSLAGLRAELDLLSSVLGDRAESVDEAVRRGVLVDVGDGLRFRHELARMAVADDVPPMRHVAIQRGILAWLLSNRPDEPSRIAHHAEAAGDHATAYRASVDAARESARLSAHREAVLQYERALRLAPRGTDDLVDLLEALSYEQYLTDRIEDAISTRARALALRQEAGDRLGIVNGHRWLSRLQWFNANAPASREHGRRAVELLQPDDAGPEAAMALSNMAQLSMLAGDLEGARTWGGRALEIARAIPARDIISHALNNIGTAELEAGVLEGRELLVEALTIALEDDLQEHAARAYTNLVSSAWTRRDVAETERFLGPALTYCTEHDLSSWSAYITGHLAEVRAAQGRWDEALDAADRVLAAQHSAPVSRIGALVARATVEVRTGAATAGTSLAQAHELAAASDELQRLAPTAIAEAEAAWLAGDSAPPLLVTAYDAALVADAGVYRDQLAVWLHRFGLLTAPPTDARDPYRLELEGRAEEAAAAWDDLGCAYDAGVALAQDDHVHLLELAVRRFSDLGATATAAAVGARLTALGGRVPRQRRASTREHPAGLTAREADVLALLADARSNAEIAEALTISRRTAENHVAALITKLGATNRHDAVAVATERGWIPT
ncbi:MAG: LuxR C-terminal-related transcriptional regulator [Candidatus Nanopelagicales bacterium]